MIQYRGTFRAGLHDKEPKSVSLSMRKKIYNIHQIAQKQSYPEGLNCNSGKGK